MMVQSIWSDPDESRAAEIEAVLDHLADTLETARQELLNLRPDHTDWPRWWREITYGAEAMESLSGQLRRIEGARMQDANARGYR